MQWSLFHKLLFSILFTLTIYSCHHQHSSRDIEQAMHHYDRLIESMDEDSIALIFTSDGDLGGIARGQDSIRKFLAGFKNKKIRVLSSVSNTASVLIHSDSAFQKGSYEQVDLINERDSFRVKGKYEAHWIWLREQGWRIRKMQTFPG